MTDDTQTRLAALAGTRNPENLPNRHSCGTRWAGTNTCHCAAPGCCQTFTGIGAFDRHRRGGTCADPATIGMVLASGRAYPAWTIPDTAQAVAA